MKENKKAKQLSKAQLAAASNYLIDISKTIALVLLLGLLFKQNNVLINLYSGIIGLVVCVISFTLGIILLKEESQYVK